MIGSFLRIAQLYFPAIAILYIVAAAIWDVPLSHIILALMCIFTLLATVLAIREEYYAGTIEVERFPDGNKRYSLVLEADPEDLDTRKKVVFYVEDTRD